MEYSEGVRILIERVEKCYCFGGRFVFYGIGLKFSSWKYLYVN